MFVHIAILWYDHLNEPDSGGQQVNTVKRIFETMRRCIPADASFESYYGALARHQSVGGPTAAEARRDFAVIRQHIDRTFSY